MPSGSDRKAHLSACAEEQKQKAKITTIVINTPAGNTGRVVSDQLLQAKEQLVIISRHPQKVSDLVERGARLMEGSIDDALVLDRALQGAETLFWVNPAHRPRADHADWSARTAQGIGRPVRYVEVTVAQVKRELLDAGIPSEVVEYIGELYTEEVAGRADHIEPRSAETTTKTSLLEFSRNVIKPAVEAALRHERQTQIQIQEK
jgi:hypothetical protein